MKDGFIKVAAASPVIRVADTSYNADVIIDCINRAEELGVKVLVFPELCITGCTCGDLLHHQVLLNGAKEALYRICDASYGIDMLIFVGLPLAVGSNVYSCAAAVCDGNILGIVPKENGNGIARDVNLDNIHSAFFCTDILFENAYVPALKVAVEIGSDIMSVNMPSRRHAIGGATVIARMASFPETIRSTDTSVRCICSDSARLACGMLLAAPGRGESTTDNAYSGLCLVAEDGDILAQDEGADALAVSEIDIQYLMNVRARSGDYDSLDCPHLPKYWGKECAPTSLTRAISKYPHLPSRTEDFIPFCERILDIQISGLEKRLKQTGIDHCTIGISGGVDSTLAVMVSAMTLRRMGLPSTNVVAITMPCFGTTSRTKNNAIVVAEQLGCEVRVINISGSVNAHFDEIGHARDDYSVAFENAQARMRTMVLMDVANKINGLNVGTEDLSEYIDGWCTFNGDHISNYDVNMGLTKTQVRAVVRHIALTTEDDVLKAALFDVLDCPVTPELLPVFDDKITQKSEEAVGSYALQDFFNYYILMCGATPSKAFRLAKIAYSDEFSDQELKRWLTSWCKRLFSQQFKRSCLMDGPSICSFSVSPRTSLHFPSDGECALLLEDLEKIGSEEDIPGYHDY